MPKSGPFFHRYRAQRAEREHRRTMREVWQAWQEGLDLEVPLPRYDDRVANDNPERFVGDAS